MKRLSSPISGIKPLYDVVVIGSGYGGSITASRMARAGKKVCLLEKGKEFQPGEYPNRFLPAVEETQIDTPGEHIGKQTGLIDVSVNQEINVVKGCGLGGTSLINANVGMEPDDVVLDDPRWPQALREDRATLKTAYRNAKEMLQTVPYPDRLPMPAKALSMKTAAEKMGVAGKWRYTPIYVNFDIDGKNRVGVEQKPCEKCGDCCSGCNFKAKNTMIMNYLPDAINHGAEIYTQVNVRYIEKQDKIWNIHYSLLQTGEEKFDAATDFISAPVVVLGAGALGSTELLLRSAEKGLPCSGMLGTHFTGNGDFLAFGYNDELRANSIGDGIRKPDELDPIGPNISSIIDLRNCANASEGMVIEEGVVPGAMSAAFSAMISLAAETEGQNTGIGISDRTRKAKRDLESLVFGPYHGAINHTMVYLVMTMDDDHGKMTLENDRLRIDWPGAGQQPIYQK
ncbi:MAG TPA: GMC family oxidoreductase N-terminal domain-containing protein, partial [Puia sp.]|nr:GMC family oxidoreductase N-terminal domain-containing protein [Puia sp.]